VQSLLVRGHWWVNPEVKLGRVNLKWVNLGWVNLGWVNLGWVNLSLVDVGSVNLALASRPCGRLACKFLARHLAGRSAPNRRFVGHPLMCVGFSAYGTGGRRFLGRRALREYDSGIGTSAPILLQWVRCEDIRLRRSDRLTDRRLRGVQQCICGRGRRLARLATPTLVARDERKTRLRLLRRRSRGGAFARILGRSGASFLDAVRRLLRQPLRGEAAPVADAKRLCWKYSVDDIGGIRRG
jgi:hypothetical protein